MNGSLDQLSERSLESASYDAGTREWVFMFSDSLPLRVSAPWRVQLDRKIALGWEDDGHRFGLPEPVDAAERLNAMLSGKSVDLAAVSQLGDLSISFGEDCALEVFNASCGYEGWQLQGPGDKWVVAQGGGTVLNSGEDG